MVYGILVTVAVKDNGTVKVSDWTISQKKKRQEQKKNPQGRPNKVPDMEEIIIRLL
jgi:hypothetical protein